MYRLVNDFASGGSYTVTIVGCGGTGSFAADGLCRLLPKGVTVALIDHDRVEQGNISRQNFSNEDLGRFKSEALAIRLSHKYNRSIAYSTRPVAFSEIRLPGLVIGCVDNGSARVGIEKKARGLTPPPRMGYTSWLIDAGNGNNYGQILIGNCRGGGFDPASEICYGLPYPLWQRPDLLQQIPEPEPGCQDLPEQGPTINQVMAALLVEVVRKIIEGTCTWMQLYISLENFNLTTVEVTPEHVSKITGIKKNKLERR